MAPPHIRHIRIRRLDLALREPFSISTGARAELRNVLVVAELSNGIRGFGEGAPMAEFNSDSQKLTLSALERATAAFIGREVSDWRGLLELVDRTLESRRGAARAALGMALLDAWARWRDIPLRLLFGGAESTLRSDVTVTLVPAPQARLAARRIRRMGVDTIKIKVGKDLDEDQDRVLAVAEAAPKAALILDANQGYGPRDCLKLLRRLSRHGITPALFEQPADKDDWQGLRDVHRFGKVLVAADESVSSPEQALRMAKERAAQVINVKLMKAGLLAAWDIALIAKGSGLGLMIGGMVESQLAMGCAAHLAAGVGGFKFVDLDTPLWLKASPMRGLRMGRGGLYDLASKRPGIGVRPD